MRSYEATPRSLLRDAQIRQHPHWEVLESFAERWVTALRVAETVQDWQRLHEALLESTANWQALLEEDESKISQTKQLLATVRPDTESGTENLKVLRTGIEFEIDVLKASINVLRCLADALVWSVVEYDRAKLTCIGDGRLVRRLADPEGRSAEFDRLHKLEHEGAVVVHADLSTHVRHGDLLIAPSWVPRSFHLEEVKAGRGGGTRRARQKARLERLNELLATGRRPAGDGERELVLRYCPVATSTHAHRIGALLAEAERDGYARTTLEEGFLAEVIVIDSLESGFSASDHNAEFMDQHGIATEDALVAATTHRRLRDRKYTFSGQLPLSLLPYQPSHVAGLLTGRLEVVLSCDARALEARFASAGMMVEVHRAKDGATRFLTARRGEHQLTVPAPTRDQVVIEGLTLDCLVRRVAWMFEEMPPPGETRDSAVAFRDEADAFKPLESDIG